MLLVQDFVLEFLAGFTMQIEMPNPLYRAWIRFFYLFFLSDEDVFIVDGSNLGKKKIHSK